MNVKEFYQEVGGDYNEVFSQLGDDESISIFLKKFIAKDELNNLKNYLNKKKYKEAFICVHNMKGYGLNMALTKLHEASSVLCEELRNGKPNVDIKPLVANLEDAYNRIEKNISLLGL